MIENYQRQNEKLYQLGKLEIELLNYRCKHKTLTDLCKFIKGYEIGSKSYIESNIHNDYIQYIRVGDLLSLSNVYTQKVDNLVLCNQNDILIAFDGAPGRNAIGLNGAISSGIYKIQCKLQYKGLIYFEINSDLNQKIIKNNSQGTTILHAAKSIPLLKTADVNDNYCKTLNILLEKIIKNKQAISFLSKIKQMFLEKYF